MENPNSKFSKFKVPLLILAVVVVLGGGGFAIWRLLGKKSDEEPIDTSNEPTTPKAPVTGRTNVSSKFTAEQLSNLAINPDYEPPTNTTPVVENVVWIGSTEGQNMVRDEMERISTTDSIDFIRAEHKIGKNILDGLTPMASAMIKRMLSQLDKVDANDYLTYPIYSKYEPGGNALRTELEKFLAKKKQDYNLSNKRNFGDSHWISSLMLNLMYGGRTRGVDTADQIWWPNVADRAGLDFYKWVNGYDVPDRKLLHKQNGQGIYYAETMYNFVKKWLVEIDELDYQVREYAIKNLREQGLIRMTKPQDQDQDQ